MEERKYYVNCPYCGSNVMKLMPGSDVETECRKCRKFISAALRNDGFILVGYGEKHK